MKSVLESSSKNSLPSQFGNSPYFAAAKCRFLLQVISRSTTYGKLAEGGVINWAEDGFVQHTPQKGDFFGVDGENRKRAREGKKQKKLYQVQER